MKYYPTIKRSKAFRCVATCVAVTEEARKQEEMLLECSVKLWEEKQHWDEKEVHGCPGLRMG